MCFYNALQNKELREEFRTQHELHQKESTEREAAHKVITLHCMLLIVIGITHQIEGVVLVHRLGRSIGY